MTCYEATCHAIWLRNFISTLEVVHSISKPLKLLCDNFVVVSFSRSTSHSKHTPMTSMLANPLTKGLPICVFQEHVTHMRLL